MISICPEYSGIRQGSLIFGHRAWATIPPRHLVFRLTDKVLDTPDSSCIQAGILPLR